MDRDELAVEYFEKVANCAQAVLAGCADLTGLDEKTALAVAGGFGGGVTCGEVCGALSGAVMALGMIFPNNCVPPDEEAKARLHRITNDCCARFREEFGTVLCRELLEKAPNYVRCPEFVQFAAQLVGDLAEENDAI